MHSIARRSALRWIGRTRVKVVFDRSDSRQNELFSHRRRKFHSPKLLEESFGLLRAVFRKKENKSGFRGGWRLSALSPGLKPKTRKQPRWDRLRIVQICCPRRSKPPVAVWRLPMCVNIRIGNSLSRRDSTIVSWQFTAWETIKRNPRLVRTANYPGDSSVTDKKQMVADRIADSFVPQIRQLLLTSLAALTWFAVCSPPHTSAVTNSIQSNKPNLSGTWTLDLSASTSLDLLMNQIGASPFDRKYAASTRLTATLNQTEETLTVAARGPGFALDQTLYLDGRTDIGNLNLLGATSLNVKTAWSKDNKQLVETHQIRTKQGKDGNLIIKRYLLDQGKTLVVVYSLKLNAESSETSGRQIWRKQA
jgi:hypothetical protein